MTALDPPPLVTDSAQLARRRLVAVVGALLLVAAVGATWHSSTRQGFDFFSLHAVGLGVLKGEPIYDPVWVEKTFQREYGFPGAPPGGVFYPPSTGVVMLPFALLPGRPAQLVWFCLMLVAVVLGFRMLLRAAKPQAASELWTFVTALVLLSACVRWGFTPLQGAPLVLGLLAIMFATLHGGQHVLATLIAVVVTAFKFTLALPFIGLLALHRRYTGVAIAALGWVVLNTAGFARVGGATALDAYRKNAVALEADPTNSPNPWDLGSIHRLDWTYLFCGLGIDPSHGRLLAVGFSGLVLLWLARESLRMGRDLDLVTSAAFLSALVCISLLSVYHHHYDVSLILAPWLVCALEWKRFRRAPSAIWCFVPLLVLIAAFPVAMARRVGGDLFGPTYVGLMNLAFPIATTLALVSSIVAIRALAGERTSATR